METIIISDLHLGSDVCQAKHLNDFLEHIKEEENTDQLILNGDVFDSWDFRRLHKKHWHVLSLLRKMSKHMHVIWVEGNHDGPAELISHLIGIDVVKDYTFKSGNKTVFCHHGHRFDTFIDSHPILTKFADFGYWILMKMDSSFALAKSAKHASKTFLRNSEIIKQKSIELAIKQGIDIICTGHTHSALILEGEVEYLNSGCWTETPCTYLTINKGIAELHAWEKE